MTIIFLKAATAARATEAQLDAGNYKKKHLRFQGLDISIENQKGSVRRWEDRDGSSGETKMLYDYGDIKRTLGKDDDAVDCCIGPNPDATHAYVVTQMALPDFVKVDEQKCMLGFDSLTEAKAAYLAHYDNPRFLGSIKAMLMDEFKRKVLATREGSQMVKAILFFKTHIDGYTKNDGTFVRTHEDSRVAKMTSAERKARDWAAQVAAGASRLAELSGIIQAARQRNILTDAQIDRAACGLTRKQILSEPVDEKLVASKKEQLDEMQRVASESYVFFRDKEERRELDLYMQLKEYRAKKAALEPSPQQKIDRYLSAPIASFWRKDFLKKIQAEAPGRNMDSEAKLATLEAIVRAAKKRGWIVEHTSSSNSGRVSSRYIEVPGGRSVRISDHYLPMSPQREYQHSQGLTGRWDDEIVVDDWRTESLDSYLNRIAVGEKE